MNLVIVSRSIYPLHGYGGMERHCHDWILDMAARSCTVNVITMPPETNFYPDFPTSVRFNFLPGHPARKVLVRISQYPHWVNSVRKFLVKFLERERVDAVYANGLTAAGCIGLSVPVFYNPHGMEEFKTSGIKWLAYSSFRSMSRHAAQGASKVIATDQILVAEIRKFLGVPDTKIVTIPNSVRTVGAGLRPARPVFSQEIISGDPLFLSVGRLEFNKGFHILLHSLAKAKELPSDWKLVIAGDGSKKDELRRLAASSGIDSHVLFMEQVSEEGLNELYRTAQLFIHPTLYEGSSIVTLEAMMNRLPVIATTAGGLTDKVRPDLNGWLVPPGNVEALTKTIIEACSKRERWNEMGKASQKIVDEQFSWERNGALYLETFRKNH